MQTRIYADKIEIDNNSTKEFWENRANNINNLQTVLLGSDKTGIEQNTRNEHEKLIVESVVKQIQNPRILDIGCGIGRWAENLINQFGGFKILSNDENEGRGLSLKPVIAPAGGCASCSAYPQTPPHTKGIR